MPEFTVGPRGQYLRSLVNEAMAAAGPGGHVVYKWTCTGCGERVGFDDRDVLYVQALHTEKIDGSPCGVVTDLSRDEKAEPGYLLVLRMEDPDALQKALRRRDAVRQRN